MLSKKKKQTINIPNSIAESIPYDQVYENGLIEVRTGVFSKSYQIEDVNFKTANQDKQYTIAQQYGEFLGSFDTGVSVEVTLYNRTVSIEQFQSEVLLDMKSDNLNAYRSEYNEMLLEKMTGAKNNLQVSKIITVTTPATDIVDAIEIFAQIDRIVSERMSHMTQHDAPPLSTIERLEILNSIYNQDSNIPLYRKQSVQGETAESFSLENCANQGITTKDVIAPSELVFNPNYIVVGDLIARTYYISNYPTWIKGTLLTDFASISTNALTSAYFNPIPQDEAIKLVKRQRTNIASSLVEIQKKASGKSIDPSLISPELTEAKKETNELMDDMTKDNSRLFVANIVITLFATDQDALNTFEGQLKMIASKNLVTVKKLSNQQENGFNSALPIGNNKLEIQRLMTTSTVSAVIPFDVKEVRMQGGMYYGQNALSKNMILYDRTTDINPNGCILGMPGAGKSFSAKREMINVLLNTDDEVYVIDPEREYALMAKALGGSVIKLENGSSFFLNPFDMNIENADEGGDPVKVKTDFIETICEIAIGGRYGLSPIEKSIIDRCVIKVYERYILHLKKTGLDIDTKHAPTMVEFYDELCMQPQPEAQNIALSLERFVKGASDIFAHKTTVEINNRFTVYDIKEIGSGLKELGLQICLDNIWNKMISNRAKGKRTWFYIDEFYLMMQKPTSAAYIAQIWKRARKWNGVPTAITQNVEDMLKSEEARTIINNSSFIVLLGQSPINKRQLSDLLDISPEEQKYISTAKPGMGLLRIKDSIIPMDDTFPKNSLYKIMTTKPADDIVA
jgi:type IV secretory pathway VirB4 component